MTRPLAQQVFSLFPPMIALALIFLSAVPLSVGTLSYAPNIAWLMTWIMVSHAPVSWPRWLAFTLGLLQDVLFATPLGSQALLALILAQIAAMQHGRPMVQHFRVRWLESAGVIMAAHITLWVIISAVSSTSPPLSKLLMAGVVNAAWYPLFYQTMTRGFAALAEDN